MYVPPRTFAQAGSPVAAQQPAAAAVLAKYCATCHNDQRKTGGLSIDSLDLNRTQYANAVRDLLDIDIDSRSLLAAEGSEQEGSTTWRRHYRGRDYR